VTALSGRSSQHQSLLHFVRRRDGVRIECPAKVRGDFACPVIERAGPIAAFISTTRPFPRMGTASCCGASAYCGQLYSRQLSVAVSFGCQSSCQPAGGLAGCSCHAWCLRRHPRKKAGVPISRLSYPRSRSRSSSVAAFAAGLSARRPLADGAGYGNHRDLRAALTALELSDVAARFRTPLWCACPGSLAAQPYVPGRADDSNISSRCKTPADQGQESLALTFRQGLAYDPWREGTTLSLKSALHAWHSHPRRDFTAASRCRKKCS